MTQPVYSRAHPGKYLLVIDTETTGSTFGTYEETFSKYQVIALGLIVATTDTFEPVAKMYVEIKFDDRKYQWSMDAERIHGITREHLEINGKSNEDAAADVAEFIFTHFGISRVMVLGHNVGFDIAALNQLLAPHEVMPQIHHVNIDTASLGFVTIGAYKSNDVFKFFYGDRTEIHNALDDANMALTVARSIRAIFKEALGS